MLLKRGDSRVLVVSDLQEPFAHRDAFEFVKAVRDHYETTETVVIGDEEDFHALSGRFPHDPDGMGPGDELRACVRALEKWYEEFPEAKVCTSNHLERIFIKAFYSGLPRQALKSINDLLEAPDGWEWRKNWTIDGVKYEHGDAGGGIYAARNLAITNRQSTVIGHHHAHGGLYYIANDLELIFGLNVGCLIDRSAYAFRYGDKYKFKPTLGCGVVIHGVPSFVPMVLSGKRERWIGELIV